MSTIEHSLLAKLSIEDEVKIKLPTPDPAQPTFLGVPREVRDRIYGHVFSEMEFMDSDTPGGVIKTVVRPKDPYALLRTCKQVKTEAERFAHQGYKITYHWRASRMGYELFAPVYPRRFYESVRTLKMYTEAWGTLEKPGMMVFLYSIFPNLEVVHYGRSHYHLSRNTHRDLVAFLDNIAESGKGETPHCDELMGILSENLGNDTSAIAAHIIARETLTVCFPVEYRIVPPTPPELLNRLQEGKKAWVDGGYWFSADLVCDRNGVRFKDISCKAKELSISQTRTWAWLDRNDAW